MKREGGGGGNEPQCKRNNQNVQQVAMIMIINGF